ncbi:10789_t:CDS:10 [Ambispora leptoticha]|uniref:10789_t:CDS:1 n=1 Tax=Ambispora leptoticha TaxID=144679 RepID=A0A9N9FC38_9GLOM|nr:10789_t:CDS:10 [Ambispora leptoticha]
MYAQPPPPPQQQTQQRPAVNPNQQQQPLTTYRVGTAQPAQPPQPPPGWRPGAPRPPFQGPAGVIRPTFPPGQRPVNGQPVPFQRPPTPAGMRPPVPPGQTPPPGTAAPPQLTSQRPPLTSNNSALNAGYQQQPQQTIVPNSSQPLQYPPTRPPVPPGNVRPLPSPDNINVDNVVNQMETLSINQGSSQYDQISKPKKPPNRVYHHLTTEINTSGYPAPTATQPYVQPAPPNMYSPTTVNNINQPGQEPSPNYNSIIQQPPPPGQGMQTMMPPQYMQTGQVPGPPQPSQQQQPPQPPRPNSMSAPRARIDPNQIPSPVVVQEHDQTVFDEQPYLTCSKTATIPLASTDFKAIDEGNSNPRFMRLTLYSIPNTEELLQTSHLPLGVVLQPLAKLRNDEASIQTVDFGENGPVRCRRCKSYINPWVIFLDGGQRYICNMCQFSNEVPPEYFCNLDMSGRRADLDQRPELKFGTVEFTAPKEYWARPPSPVSHIFAIDVSWNAIKSGMLVKCVEAIQDILYNTPNSIPQGGKIGIITFDKDIHFYNLTSTIEQAQMLVVPDINDVFVPLHSGLLVDPIESREVIKGLLNSLPTMFAENKTSESVLGSVVKASLAALNETGGKVLVFQTSLPISGPGAIRHRDDPKLYNTEKEKTLFGPQDGYYKNLAIDCVDAGIAIDLFLFPITYIDVATIGLLSSLTGGETYFYPNFDAEKDGKKFANELKHNITREFGYNALMRIRCSNGLKVDDHYGNFNMRNSTDLELAGIDSDKAFGALLKYDGKLDEKSDAFIQCALLYTTSTGERRVRTHNLSIPVTTLLGNVFRHADMDTTVNFLAKQAVSNTVTKPLREIRDQLTDKCVKILMSYRRHCASASSAGQLILPEAFKLFPLYTLTMLKSKALRGGGNLTSDIRVHFMRLIKSIGVAESIVLFYPRMFPVHNLPEKIGYPDEHGRVKLPPSIRVSISRLESGGAYLLENGQTLIFWIGRQISPEFVKNVFGVDSIDFIDPKTSSMPELDNQTSIQIRTIISYLQSQRSKYLQLTIARMQIDPAEIEFNNLLVEDENNFAMSYVDYLCYIHKQIQTEYALSL